MKNLKAVLEKFRIPAALVCLLAGVSLFLYLQIVAQMDAQGAVALVFGIPFFAGPIALARYLLQGHWTPGRWLVDGVAAALVLYYVSGIASIFYKPLGAYSDLYMKGMKHVFVSYTGKTPYAWAKDEEQKTREAEDPEREKRFKAIWQEIQTAGKCKEASECVNIGPICPFGCNVVINANNQPAIEEKIHQFLTLEPPKQKERCEAFDCDKAEFVECYKGRCIYSLYSRENTEAD